MGSMTFHVDCQQTGLGVCRCGSAPMATRSLSSTAAHGLWGAWSTALYNQQVPQLEVVNVQLPQLYVLPGPVGVTVADTTTAAAAAANKRRLLGAVNQAERKATSLANRVKLLSEALGQDFKPPEGMPLAGADVPTTIARLQQEMQQLQDHQQHLEQQYTTAEAERQQLVVTHREQAAQLQQHLEAARRAAGGGSGAAAGRHKQQRLQGAGQRGSSSFHDFSGEPPRGKQKQRAGPREALLPQDFGIQLSGQRLELYWPDDGTWYRGQVVSVNMQQQTAIIMYETGEEENVNLLSLIRKQEVAWGDE